MARAVEVEHTTAIYSGILRMANAGPRAEKEPTQKIIVLGALLRSRKCPCCRQ
jgi:hypothetical protein